MWCSLYWLSRAALPQHRATSWDEHHFASIRQLDFLEDFLPPSILEDFIDLACPQPPVLWGGLTALRIFVFWRDPDCQSASREERLCLLPRARLASRRHQGGMWVHSLEPLTDHWLFCTRVAGPTAGGWDAKMRRTQSPSGVLRHVGK